MLFYHVDQNFEAKWPLVVQQFFHVFEKYIRIDESVVINIRYFLDGYLKHTCKNYLKRSFKSRKKYKYHGYLFGFHDFSDYKFFWDTKINVNNPVYLIYLKFKFVHLQIRILTSKVETFFFAAYFNKKEHLNQRHHLFLSAILSFLNFIEFNVRK